MQNAGRKELGSCFINFQCDFENSEEVQIASETYVCNLLLSIRILSCVDSESKEHSLI